MIRSLAIAASLVFALSACSDPVGDKPRATVSDAKPAAAAPAAPTTAPAGEVVKYAFSQDGSKLSFTGAKITGKHEGSFEKFTGTVGVVGGKAEGAKIEVEIDMSSVKSDDEKLTGHLKAPDFFDVAQFPTAKFVSSSIGVPVGGKTTITGNLTLHGVTKQIAFPATVTVDGDTASAQAEFAINRKDFNIVYPGKPDDLIKDDVLLKLDIKAKKG
jgi:polyisoprenoid-binding protein YceI